MDGFITEENVVSSESNEWSLDEVKKALSLLRWQRESINSQVYTVFVMCVVCLHIECEICGAFYMYM